jgi:hypothetical protein
MPKHVEIAKVTAGYEVRLVEKKLLGTWVKHKTICGGLSLAESGAKSIATQNGQCKVKNVTESRQVTSTVAGGSVGGRT